MQYTDTCPLWFRLFTWHFKCTSDTIHASCWPLGIPPHTNHIQKKVKKKSHFRHSNLSLVRFSRRSIQNPTLIQNLNSTIHAWSSSQSQRSTLMRHHKKQKIQIFKNTFLGQSHDWKRHTHHSSHTCSSMWITSRIRVVYHSRLFHGIVLCILTWWVRLCCGSFHFFKLSFFYCRNNEKCSTYWWWRVEMWVFWLWQVGHFMCLFLVYVCVDCIAI